MVDFAREKEILDLLGIECRVDVVIGSDMGADVIYEPAENRAQIYALGFTDFVEAAGKLKVGLTYHPLFATPVFSDDMDFERKKVAAKITMYWEPLLAGWGWKEVRSTVPEEALDALRRELRLEMDTMAINRMMEGKRYKPVELIRKQVGYAVLGGTFAVRIRAGSEKTEKLYKKYLETLFTFVEEEPSFDAMKEIGKIFFPQFRIELANDGSGSFFLLEPDG